MQFSIALIIEFVETFNREVKENTSFLSMGARKNFGRGGGGEPQNGPPPKKKEKKVVLSPFLGGSEACSPKKILTMVLPTSF